MGQALRLTLGQEVKVHSHMNPEHERTQKVLQESKLFTSSKLFLLGIYLISSKVYSHGYPLRLAEESRLTEIEDNGNTHNNGGENTTVV